MGYSDFRVKGVKFSVTTTVTKQCKRCEEREIRLNARYCCWCGTAFDLVIHNGVATKVVPMIEPIEQAERIDRE